MKGLIFCVVIIGLVFSAGCAGRRSGVIIDPAGVDMGRYQTDLTECQEIAQQVDQKAGAGAIGGAVVGGLVGVVVGNRGAAERLAGAGAVVGGARGVSATRQEKQVVVKNCLRNRGYKVLN